MMKSVPALLLLEWAGKGVGGRSARFVLKIKHDGGRGLVELGFYDDLARHAEGPGARGEVRIASPPPPPHDACMRGMCSCLFCLAAVSDFDQSTISTVAIRSIFLHVCVATNASTAYNYTLFGGPGGAPRRYLSCVCVVSAVFLLLPEWMRLWQ